MDDENDLIYHSLSSSEMNVYLNNDEFWTINEYKGEIYFQIIPELFLFMTGEKSKKRMVLTCPHCPYFTFGRCIYTFSS